MALRVILQQRYSLSVLQPHEQNHKVTVGSPNSDKKTEEVINVEEQLFIDKLIKLFNQEYNDTYLSLPYITNKVAMSERQLQRKTKAIFGITFSELLRNHRLTHSCSLLLDGLPVAIVAEQVGFNSSSYFVRCFKAKYGKTQNIYRETN